MKSLQNERCRELLALKATEGLPSYEQLELDLLLAETPALAAESMDKAAAAIDLAFTKPTPLPPFLRDKLSKQADAHFSDAGVSGSSTTSADVLPFPQRDPQPEPAPAPRSSSSLAWWAAAACLILAVSGWWPRLAQTPIESGPSRIVEAPLNEKAAQLAGLNETVVKSWTSTEDPLAKAVIGEVIWNPTRQEGYMRFRGLPINDPAQFQYQLWIFDVQQDERYPIDGGVFDITTTGEVVIPIINKIDVSKATLFAVTVEKPGGVVVSNRDRLVVLAET